MNKLLKNVLIFPKRIVIFLINCYQKYISPYKKPSCKYYPTCSQYSKQAIDKYGIIKGSFLSIKRILKCNPFSNGGVDKLK